MPSDGAAPEFQDLPTSFWSQVHLWKAGVTNACLIAALLVTGRWWVRWAFVPKPESPPRIGRPTSKISWVFLLGALILASCLRLPLMDRPVLPEEQDNLRRNIHGYTEGHDDDTEEWRPTNWNDAFYDNRLANNPILTSVTAKASLELWRVATGLPEDRFHPFPIRLPSLLAGLGSIFLIWRILHWFGYRCAALFAAFFLAIHPTAIDFHVQARGHSLCMFFELLAIASAYLALRTLRWRWWILYGLSLMLCLYANLAAVHFAIGINFFLTIYLLRRIWRARTRTAAWPQLVRMTVANLLAAILFLQAAKPAIAQAEHYLNEQSPQNELEAEWIFSAWNHIVAGAILPTPEEWRAGSAEGEHHSLTFLTLVVSPALLIFGTARLARGNRYAAPLALGGLAAPHPGLGPLAI